MLFVSNQVFDAVKTQTIAETLYIHDKDVAIKIHLIHYYCNCSGYFVFIYEPTTHEICNGSVSRGHLTLWIRSPE